MKRLIPIVPLALLAACSKPAGEEAPAAAPSSSATVPPVAVSPSASASSGPTSRYTSLKDCEVTDSNEGEDWSQSHCDGPDGWALQIDYGDARDDAQLLQKGKPAKPLNLLALTGGGFNTLGDTMEWRSPGSGAPPAALIMRNSVVEDPERPERPTALLLVVDLQQGCVVAQIRPQSGQNEKARAVADGPKQPCLKGNS